jgi:hypothetical protein
VGLTRSHFLVNVQPQQRILHDLTQGRMNPVLTSNEVGDKLTA